MRAPRPAIVALGALLLLALVAPAGTAQEADDDFAFVDISNFPTVHVVITPPAGTGTLDDGDVTLYQDGEEVPVTVTELGSEPIEVVLLIDTSGSMIGAPMDAAKQAAIDFVDSLPAGSDVAVLGFGNEVSIVADLGASAEELDAAIQALVADGETALYDAVIAAAQAVELGARDRQFIVLLSDGGDTASAATLGEVGDQLAAIDVGFYAIELEGSELDSAVLTAMATSTTSGRVVSASDSEALAGVYGEIAAEVASQYAVTFRAIRGGVTDIEVVVAGVSYNGTLQLPAISGESSPITLSTSPLARELTPAPVRVISQPSSLQQEWAFRIGILLLTLTLILLFAFALQPATEPKRSVLLPGPGAKGRRRLPRLSRALEATQERVEGVLQRRPTKGVDAALEAAGIAVRGSEFLAIVAVVALAGLAIGALSGSLMLGLLLFVGALLVPRLWLARAADRRREAFGDQLEGTLQLMAGSLRAGYGLTQAVSTVAEEAPTPTREEFGRIVVEIRLGRDLPDALRALADRMRNEDFGWVADAISIQQEVGGNLAEVLDAVGQTIRDRNNIRRQVHALSAEGRISAVVLISLPFGLAGIISIVNPGYLNTLFESGVGRVLLVAGAVLMSIGITWIRRLVKIVF